MSEKKYYYKEGIGKAKYTEVSLLHRKLALIGSPEARSRNKNPRRPLSPMAQDLLDGKTLFAYDPRELNGKRRHAHGTIFTSLYMTALRYGKKFRCVSYDMFMEEGYRGYILWMEDPEEAEELSALTARTLKRLAKEA